MSKFIRISPQNVDLYQEGFNVSFTDEFNVVINGVEFPPSVLLKIAQQMIFEQQRIKKAEIDECINDCISNTSFYPEIDSKKGGIYTIEDCYIGRSVDIKKRIKQHIFQAFNGTHCNKLLAQKIKDAYDENGGLTIYWQECEPNDLNEAIVISDFISMGVDLVNIDLRGLSLLNNN